jgi:hypothetical protein
VGRKRFEREVRGRYKLKDPDYVGHLWEEFGADYDNAGNSEKLREELFYSIGERVASYRFGQSSKDRGDRQRDQSAGAGGFHEEQLAIKWHPGSVETARAEAVSEYVAKVASMDTETIRYRDQVLGRTLTAEEAKRFLSSPVAALVRARIRPRAKPQDVSYLDYELEEQAEDDSGPYRMLRYGHAGRERETRLRPLLQVPGRSDFLVYAGDAIFADEWWQQIPDQHVDALLLPTHFDYSVVAGSNSTLDVLMEQANKLVRRYLLEPAEAAWLILTGEPPKPKYMSASLSSLDIAHLSRAVLTLTVEPWVSPDNVKSYYQEIRQSVLHGAGCKHRTVEVFRFVVAHTEIEESTLMETPEWSRLCDLWNQEYPEDHPWHFSDYRDLRKSYTRGREAIAFPLAE